MDFIRVAFLGSLGGVIGVVFAHLVIVPILRVILGVDGYTYFPGFFGDG